MASGLREIPPCEVTDSSEAIAGLFTAPVVLAGLLPPDEVPVSVSVGQCF